jgi:hypothetical protein
LTQAKNRRFFVKAINKAFKCSHLQRLFSADKCLAFTCV